MSFSFGMNQVKPFSALTASALTLTIVLCPLILLSNVSTTDEVVLDANSRKIYLAKGTIPFGI